MDAASPIMQVAFVVEDIHVEAARWAKELAVGPFFVLEHVRYRSLVYRGAPCEADISIAFAFSGDLQIELVCQHNAAPSVFRDAIDAWGYGAQHLGRVSDNLNDEVARYASRGMEPLQRGVSESGVETVFLPFHPVPAGLIELIQGSETLTQTFAFMKATAADWDGCTAIYS